MATFKALVYADGKRRDGTYNVKIRVTHKSRSLKVSTSMYVDASQLTRSLKIKDPNIITQCECIIRNWRHITNELGVQADKLDVKEVMRYIRAKELSDGAFRLDFMEFGRRKAAEMTPNTGHNHITAIKALSRFFGRDSIDISEITVHSMRDFEVYLRKTCPTSGGAVARYPALIKHLHNMAKEEYNDEDIGLIRIPQSPFSRYTIPSVAAAHPRAVSREVMQRIIDLPDAGAINITRDITRDCFLLSFGLAGMNAVDMFSLPASALRGNVIVYNRQKTRDRRDDAAEFRIRVEPEIMPLVEKYRDPTGRYLFLFANRYTNSSQFNSMLSRGMAAIQEAVPYEEHYTFYSARHTNATFGRSEDLNIDKYTIHELLNHVDREMKTTDRYLRRDWRVIWNANARIVQYLDWSAVARRCAKR